MIQETKPKSITFTHQFKITRNLTYYRALCQALHRTLIHKRKESKTVITVCPHGAHIAVITRRYGQLRLCLFFLN